MSGQPKKSKKNPPKPHDAKLFDNLLKVTEQFMRGRGFVSLSEEQLMARLDVAPQHKKIFRQVLKTLVNQGVVTAKKGCYVCSETHDNVASGTIRVHPRGFGFLQADDNMAFPQDIFIPKHLTQNAVDGDRVEVLINTESVSEKGPEGRVITILERARTHLAGIVSSLTRSGDILAYAPLLGTSQRIVVDESSEFRLREGDRIVMEVRNWGSSETETRCRVSHRLGHISEPSCDIPAAIEEYDLRGDFPIHVIEEAKNFGRQVPKTEIDKREDLRKMTCITIDPKTAEDFDDALSLTKDDKEHFHLGVHIADVSHYVRPGTALDNEAKERSNSTYFPGYCLPMLPKELSADLCSLRPNVNRLTVSVHMEFDQTGKLITHRISRSVIKSAMRFTYEEAKKVLDDKMKSPHKATLEQMVDLCHLLKKKRYERGSIEFAIPELVIRVNENGVPTGTEYVEYDITHQLVEEFMLKANEVIATHLCDEGQGLPYRIHEEPSEDNMRDFSLLASAFGYTLSETPTSSEIQKLFDEAMNTAYGQYLATNYIRRMKLAVYSPANIGHYGLGLSHYCHFTSPIRRYVDLVIHRILFHEGHAYENLESIAMQCSEQERISAKAEGNVVLLKKLRLLDTMHKQNSRTQYKAVVTHVKPFGFFFEITDFMIESFLHVSELGADFYEFNDVNQVLYGTSYGGTYHAGDAITVMLKEVDLIFLQTKWHLVDQQPQIRRKRRR